MIRIFLLAMLRGERLLQQSRLRQLIDRYFVAGTGGLVSRGRHVPVPGTGRTAFLPDLVVVPGSALALSRADMAGTAALTIAPIRASSAS